MNLPSVKTYVAIWAVLLLLLATTFGSAYIRLGTGNLVVNVTIAVAKTLLVAVFFMRLRSARVVNGLAAGAAILMLMILIGLTLTDYFTRG